MKKLRIANSATNYGDKSAVEKLCQGHGVGKELQDYLHRKKKHIYFYFLLQKHFIFVFCFRKTRRRILHNFDSFLEDITTKNLGNIPFR